MRKKEERKGWGLGDTFWVFARVVEKCVVRKTSRIAYKYTWSKDGRITVGEFEWLLEDMAMHSLTGLHNLAMK